MSMEGLQQVFTLSQNAPALAERLTRSYTEAVKLRDPNIYADTILDIADELGLEVTEDDLNRIIRLSINPNYAFMTDDEIRRIENGGGMASTMAVGEEDGKGPRHPPRRPDGPAASTMAVGEEDGSGPRLPRRPRKPGTTPDASTLAMGEEDGPGFPG